MLMPGAGIGVSAEGRATSSSAAFRRMERIACTVGGGRLAHEQGDNLTKFAELRIAPASEVL